MSAAAGEPELHFHDEEWEYTHGEWTDIVADRHPDGGPLEIFILERKPSSFAACVVLSRGEADETGPGDPDETEWRLFDTLDKAKAAHMQDVAE